VTAEYDNYYEDSGSQTTGIKAYTKLQLADNRARRKIQFNYLCSKLILDNDARLPPHLEKKVASATRNLRTNNSSTLYRIFQ